MEDIVSTVYGSRDIADFGACYGCNGHRWQRHKEGYTPKATF